MQFVVCVWKSLPSILQTCLSGDGLRAISQLCNLKGKIIHNKKKGPREDFGNVLLRENSKKIKINQIELKIVSILTFRIF